MTAGPSSLRILVIDDDALIRIATTRLLANAGHKPTQATSVATARACAAAGPYDVVITDLNMPGSPDSTILDVLRSSLPDVPIIVISGAVNSEVDEEANPPGVFEYLQKPFAPRGLLDAIVRASRTHVG